MIQKTVKKKKVVQKVKKSNSELKNGGKVKKNRKRKREEMEMDDFNENGDKKREIITIDDDTENEDVEAMNFDTSPKKKRFKKSFGRKTTEFGKKRKIVSKSIAKKKRKIDIKITLKINEWIFSK